MRSSKVHPRSQWILWTAAGGLFLAGAIAVVFMNSGHGPSSAVDDQAAPEAVERAKREANARVAVQRAKAFDAAYPKDFDGQAQSWKKAVPLCEKTAFEREARQSLDRAIAARDAERDRAAKALGPPPLAKWDFETLQGDLYAGERSPGIDQADGLVGKALRFNGRGFLRIDNADLFNAPDLTVSLWIKPVSVKGRQGLLSKRIDSKQSPIVLSLWEGAIVFEAADDSTQWPFQMKSLALVKAGEWSHVGLVARSGRGVELYLNGALIQEFKTDKHRCKNSDPLFLGREIYNGRDAHDGTAFYAGLLDELKVWNQPLSAQEMKAHYDAGAPK